MQHFKSPSVIFSLLVMTFLVVNLVWGFTEPSASPPNSNVPAPLNVGSSGQSKSGGLILNTGGATNGLLVDQGNVGIGTQNPTQKLDVAGYIRAATGLCIGSDCRTGWPSGGIQSETDPTVSASLKDGVSWEEVSGRPTIGSNLYNCPVDDETGGNCTSQGLKSDCSGISLNSTCNRYADTDGGGCQTQTYSCTLVGKVIAP